MQASEKPAQQRTSGLVNEALEWAAVELGSSRARVLPMQTGSQLPGAAFGPFHWSPTR
jgi:hypothetical protein